MLSKIEIITDFNGPTCTIQILKNRISGSFSNFTKLFLSHCQQFAFQFISFGHVCTANLREMYFYTTEASIESDFTTFMSSR